MLARASGADQGGYYDCAECARRPHLYAVQGHDGEPQGGADLFRVNMVTGEPLARCPVRVWQLAAEEEPSAERFAGAVVGTIYPAYKRGILFDAGGLGDQPAPLADALAECERLDDLVRRKMEEAAPAPAGGDEGDRGAP